MEENDKGSKLHLDLRLRQGAKKRYKTYIHQAEEDACIGIRKMKLAVLQLYKVDVSDNV